MYIDFYRALLKDPKGIRKSLIKLLSKVALKINLNLKLVILV